MKNITVRAPGDLTLEQSQKVLVTVLKRAGHPACFSGIDISFESTVEANNLVLAVDKASLNVSEVSS